MIDLSHLTGRSVAVLGLGKSGTAAIRALSMVSRSKKLGLEAGPMASTSGPSAPSRRKARRLWSRM